MLLPVLTFQLAVNTDLVSRIVSESPWPWESPSTVLHFPPTSPYLLLFFCLGWSSSVPGEDIQCFIMDGDAKGYFSIQQMVQWCLCRNHCQHPRTSCSLWKSDWFDTASEVFLWLRLWCLLLMTSPSCQTLNSPSLFYRGFCGVVVIVFCLTCKRSLVWNQKGTLGSHGLKVRETGLGPKGHWFNSLYIHQMLPGLPLFWVCVCLLLQMG